MSDQVNPHPARRDRRRYDSTRRRDQARQHRAAVLHAARERFVAQGYAATTIAEIADDAGVSVETVYKAFGNKAGVLKAVFDVSVAGDDDPVPMEQRAVIQAVIAEPDPATKIRMYVGHLASTMPRTAPVQLVARDAAAADAAAAGVWREIRAELVTAMTKFARNLAATGRLRVPVAEARDVLWTYHAPELYELLVLERRWSAKRYGTFVADALVTKLVAD